MNEAIVINHDSDVVSVSPCFEEDEIAWIQVVFRHFFALFLLLQGAARHIDTRIFVAVANQSAAIEARFRCVSSIPIRCANLGKCLNHDFLTITAYL